MNPDTPVQNLMWKMALRARELADMKLNDLRMLYPETTDTEMELVRYCKMMGYTRGQIIEAVLCEEFDYTAIQLDGRE
jgi:hypothetical protein